MKTFFLTFLISTSSLFAFEHYYPENFISNVFVERSIKDAPLKRYLFKILSSAHLKNEGHDVLLNDCEGLGQNCVMHEQISFDTRAKVVLYGLIHLFEDGLGYFVKDVYCENIFRASDKLSIGPGLKPSGNLIQIEHTWPENRFRGVDKFDDLLQKGDMHHLYPAQGNANGTRNQHKFGNVDQSVEITNCPASRFGTSLEGDKDEKYFEPPDSHKGNVARAIFYFAVRYQRHVDPKEEKVLREWHELDPVDDHERFRNNIIEKAQGNRNPFIDFPQLTFVIENF